MLARFHVRIFAATGSPSPLVSFDDAVAALARLPQIFVEPDGSFVWTAPPSSASRWQVDGNLADGGETLYYVEIKGVCPLAVFQELLGCLAPPSARLVVESVAEGVILDADAFRASLENG
jgi:hypothetical protein